MLFVRLRTVGVPLARRLLPRAGIRGFSSASHFKRPSLIAQAAQTESRTLQTCKLASRGDGWRFGLIGGSFGLFGAASLMEMLGVTPKKPVVEPRPKTEKEIVDEQLANTPWRRWMRGTLTTTQLVYGIVAANVLVFAMWRLPNNAAAMYRHWTLSTWGLREGRLHTMITSIFSHSSLVHLCFNTFFQLGALSILTQETQVDMYATVFLLAGLGSSTTSVALKLLMRESIPSVGASGALYGLFSWMCLSFPTASFSLLLTNFTFTGLQFLQGATCIEILLLLLRFVPPVARRMPRLDHAAHLGGIFSGALLFQHTYPRTFNKTLGLSDANPKP